MQRVLHGSQSYASKEQRGKYARLLLRSQLVLSAIALDLERLQTMLRISTLTRRSQKKNQSWAVEIVQQGVEPAIRLKVGTSVSICCSDILHGPCSGTETLWRTSASVHDISLRRNAKQQTVLPPRCLFLQGAFHEATDVCSLQLHLLAAGIAKRYKKQK